jgi:hypothetical protein
MGFTGKQPEDVCMCEPVEGRKPLTSTVFLLSHIRVGCSNLLDIDVTF